MSSSAAPRRSLAVALWGVLGVVAMLAEAVHRLAMKAIGILRAHALTSAEWVALAAWVIAIWYFEAYRGFQLRFSPRVVARALHLAEHPRPLHVALAPLYCMALFHTTRRRLIASWVLIAAIVGLILLVRALPPPYRAIVDVGVAFALAWGTAAMLVFLARGLSGREMPVPPDLPGEAPPEAQRAEPG